MAEAALTVLSDSALQFASSEFVRLEVLPKAIYNKRTEEAQFYQTFFAAVAVWSPLTADLLHRAFAEAQRWGLSAVDALHITSAAAVNAVEFVTTETADKPIHRTQLVAVRTIRSGS
jgi:predicted nucleic acid-binding protein